MCYSWKASLTFAVVGWATAAALLWRGRSRKYVMLPAFFAAMETIQWLQYSVADQCHSKTNQALTLLAYAHIAFQPLVFNDFVWGQAQAAFGRPAISADADRVVHKAVRRLCLAAALLTLFKAAPAVLQVLDVAPPELVGLLGPNTTRYLTGPGTWCRDNVESVCGRRLCSYTGRFHLAWSIPQLPHSYYIPSAGFLHFFLFFMPAILLGGTPQRLLGLAALLAGPLVTDRVVAGDARARRFEWASMWCLFSMTQVLLLFVIEVLGSRVFGGQRRLPASTKHIKSPYYACAGAQHGSAGEPGEGEAIAVIHMFGGASSQYPGYRQRSGFKHEVPLKQV